MSPSHSLARQRCPSRRRKGHGEFPFLRVSVVNSIVMAGHDGAADAPPRGGWRRAPRIAKLKNRIAFGGCRAADQVASSPVARSMGLCPALVFGDFDGRAASFHLGELGLACGFGIRSVGVSSRQEAGARSAAALIPVSPRWLFPIVMPGLVPGIHVLKTWMAGSSPGHDGTETAAARFVLRSPPKHRV